MRLTTREKILLFRKRNRITQRELARRLGVSMHTLSSWERGIRNPIRRNLDIINSITETVH